jgi:RNA recognition motif-containing protein
LAVRLFIGNLPYAATEADLRSHLGGVGQPLQVVLPVDRETGRPRGFAFVDFADRAIAEEAIKRFDGQPFMGRTIAVSEARAREDRPAGPRPGGFGGPPRPGGFGGAPRPGGFGPRPPSFESGPPAAGGRGAPSRNFGPPAPRRQSAAGKKQKQERGPRGPIRERTTGRFYTVDDDEADQPVDFDNFATSADDDKGGEETDK